VTRHGKCLRGCRAPIGRVAVCLACGISVHTLGDIQDLLRQQFLEYREIELDLSGVGMIDTAGLKGLLSFQFEVAEIGYTISFVYRNEALIRLLDEIRGAFANPPSQTGCRVVMRRGRHQSESAEGERLGSQHKADGCRSGFTRE
jgi:ABC-type transporter Mla MlaB component